MICDPCAGAGRLLLQPPDAHPEPQVALYAHKTKVRNLHRDCESPLSCTCQHSTEVPRAQS